MTTIGFVVPYFGKLPGYFQLWLNSCAINPTIDWLLYIDDHSTFDYPSNVKVFYTTFEKVRQKVQECFDFKISLDAPYKLCDYKPLYGVIFASELMKYDFWAECDIDLIWGDLRTFITEAVLDNDKIFKFGHCCIYRNDVGLNQIYKCKVEGVPYYKLVYSSPCSFGFDEDKGIHILFQHKRMKLFEYPFMYDVKVETKYISPASSMNEREDMQELKQAKSGLFHFSSKGLYYFYIASDNRIMQKPFMYVHLQKRKMKDYTTNKNNFFITYHSFIDSIQEIDFSIIKKNSPLIKKIYWAHIKKWFIIKWRIISGTMVPIPYEKSCFWKLCDKIFNRK